MKKDFSSECFFELLPSSTITSKKYQAHNCNCLIKQLDFYMYFLFKIGVTTSFIGLITSFFLFQLN